MKGTARRATLVAAAALAVLLGGLAPAPARAETIALWHAMSGRAAEAVQAQCQRFNQAQAAHVLRCSYQGDYARLMQKTVAAFRAGRQPTLVQFFDVALQDLLQSGAVEPVSRLYAREGDADWQDDLLPAVRDWYADDGGQLLGQPFNVSTAVLYANDSQLAAAGIPAVPATWDALQRDGRQMVRGGHRCPFVTDLDAWAALEQVAAAQGLALAVPRNGRDGLDARYALDQPALRQHVQRLMDGVREGWLRVDSQTRAGDAGAAFRTGECAMLLAATGVWTGIRGTIAKRQQVSAHLVPIGQGAARHRTHVGGAALYLMKGSSAAQQAAAMAWLRFIRQPEQQLRFSDDTGFLPFTRAAVAQYLHRRQARDPAQPMAQDVIAVGLDSLAQPGSAEAPSPRLGFHAQFRAVWKEELQRALMGRQDAPTTLANVQRRGNALLQRFALTYGGRQ